MSSGRRTTDSSISGRKSASNFFAFSSVGFSLKSCVATATSAATESERFEVTVTQCALKKNHATNICMMTMGRMIIRNARQKIDFGKIFLSENMLYLYSIRNQTVPLTTNG